MNCYHIDYQIDKEKYRNLFWERCYDGQWYRFKKPMLSWWKVFGIEDLVKDVEMDLNIRGMNNFPRFAYMFKGHDLEYHVDEDYMTSIMINLMDGPSPVMHVEDVPVSYECLLFHNGELFHHVEARKEDSLMLKFCIRHPWEEVYERLDKFDLLIPYK